MPNVRENSRICPVISAIRGDKKMRQEEYCIRIKSLEAVVDTKQLDAVDDPSPTTVREIMLSRIASRML